MPYAIVLLLMMLLLVTTSAQVSNSKGCLLHDPDKFTGFQNPPPLNFARTFSTPDDCTVPGTLYTNETTQDGSKAFSCQCVLGYTGSRCQFRLVDYTPKTLLQGDVIGPIGLGNTIPSSYHLPDRPIQLVMETNKSLKNIRFVWGCVDPESPEKYSILDQIPFVNESIVAHSSDDAKYRYGLDTSILFSFSPAFHATLSPFDSLFSLQSPPRSSLSSPITCLTLLSYEIDDDDINSSPITDYSSTNPALPQFEPIAQFTIFQKPTDLAEYIPTASVLMPESECTEPNEWHLQHTNAAFAPGEVKFWCLCPGGDPNVFGPNCEYRIELIHPSPNMVKGWYDQSVPISITEEIEFTITNLKSPTINVRGFQFRLQSVDSTNTVNTGGSITSGIAISGNVATIKTDFRTAFAIETMAGWMTDPNNFLVSIDDGSSTQHFIRSRIMQIQLTNGCASVPSNVCFNLGTQYCKLSPTPSCKCLPGWFGSACRRQIDYTPVMKGDSDDPNDPDANAIVMGSPTQIILSLHPAVINTLPGFGQNPQADLDGVTITASTSGIAAIGGEDWTNRIIQPFKIDPDLNLENTYYLSLPAVPTSALNIDYTAINGPTLSITVISISGDITNSDSIQIRLKSLCASNTKFATAITAGSVGIGACDVYQIRCKPGYYGINCLYNFGNVSPDPATDALKTTFGLPADYGGARQTYIGRPLRFGTPPSSLSDVYYTPFTILFSLIRPLSSPENYPQTSDFEDFSLFKAPVSWTVHNSQYPLYLTIVLEGQSTFIEPFQLLGCKDMGTETQLLSILKDDSYLKRPPCYQPHTVNCALHGIVDLSTDSYCTCSSGFTGPQCGTSFLYEPNPPSLTFSTILGYAAPTHLLTSNNVNWFQPSFETNGSAGETIQLSKSLIPSTFTAKSLSELGKFVGVTFSDDNQGFDRVLFDFIILSASDEKFEIRTSNQEGLKCLSNEATTIGVNFNNRDGYYCSCRPPYVGRQCEMYVIFTDSEENNISYSSLVSKQFNAGDVFKLRLGSTMPQPLNNQYTKLSIVHSGDHELNIVSELLSFTHDTTIILSDFADQNVLSFYNSDVITTALSFSISINLKSSCSQVQDKFNQSCPDHTTCDPTQDLFQDACNHEVCRPYAYTLPTDGVQCSRIVTQPTHQNRLYTVKGPKLLLKDQFVIADLPDHLIPVAPSPGRTFSSYSAIFSWPGGTSPKIPFSSRRSTDGTSVIFGFQVPSFVELTTGVEISFGEHYTNEQGTDVRVINVSINDFTIHVDPLLLLQQSELLHSNWVKQSHVLPPRPMLPCHPENTLRYSFDESVDVGVYQCICKLTWYGPECDVQFSLASFPTLTNQVPIIAITRIVEQSHIDNWVKYGIAPIVVGRTFFGPLVANVPLVVQFQVELPKSGWVETISVAGVEIQLPYNPLFESTSCDITTECTPGRTTACFTNSASGPICHCFPGFYGPKCNLQYTLPLRPSRSISIFPLILNTLKQGWDTEFYFGQQAVATSPPEPIFATFKIFASLLLFSDWGANPAPQPCTVPWGPFILSGSGLAEPFLQIWDPTIISSCEWLSKWNTATTNVKSCVISGSKSCNPSSSTLDGLCTCKDLEVNLELKSFIFTTGTYCQTRIAIPMGPYYHKQIISIETTTTLPHISPSFENISLTRSKSGQQDQTISFGKPLDNGLNYNDSTFNYATYRVEIDHDTDFDPQPTPFITEDELAALALTQFSWSIQWKDGSEPPQTQITSPDYSFRIVEACEWTQLTQHRTICAETKDDNGDYIAVESCMNPQTHEIECQCRPGYHFHECRYHYNIDAPSGSNSGQTYLGQHLTLQTNFIFEPMDTLHLYSPPSHQIIYNGLTLPVFGQDIPHQEPIRLATTSAEAFQMVNSVINPYNTPPVAISELPPLFSTQSQDTIPRWIDPVGNEIYLRSASQPDSILQGIPQFQVSTGVGIQHSFGITCPGGIYSSFGCRCGHWGVFGPNCNFKITLNPISPMINNFMGTSLVSLGPSSFEYHIAEIAPVVPTPVGKNWSIPTNFHFETLVRPSTTSPIVSSIIQIESTSSSIIFPDSLDLYHGLYLINDDPNPDLEIKQFEVFDTTFSLLTGAINPGIVSLTQKEPQSTQSPTSTIELVCRDGHFGQDCRSKIVIDMFQFELTQRLLVAADGIRPTPNVSIFFPFVLDPAQDVVIIQAYLIRAVSEQDAAAVYKKHQFTIDLNTKTISYSGPLADYDIDSLKYNIELTLRDSTTGNNSDYQISSPFTVLNPPCSLALLDCPTLYDITSALTDISAQQLLAPLSTHSNQSPLTILRPSTDVIITIPYYGDVDPTGKIQILLQQYLPTSTPGQYSTTPITISTRTISYPIPADLTDATSFTLTLPSALVATKLFYSVSFPLASRPSPLILTTPTFSAIARCRLPPINPADHADRSKWLPDCENGGQCISSTQQCKCPTGWEGIRCQIEDIPCEQCPLANISQCRSDNTCECKAGWGASDCTVDSRCLETSNKTCNGKNGQLIPPPSTSTCSKECLCNNFWIGSRCNICNIGCLNGGEPYNSCDRCGCKGGFSGDRCQCQTVLGKLIINGQSPLLVQYAELVAEQQANPNDQELSESVADTMIVVDLIRTETSDIFAKLLNLSPSSVQLSMMAIPNPSSATPDPTSGLLYTNMTFAITFGCANLNPGTTRDELETDWSAMVGPLLSNEQIKEIFVFPSLGPAIEPTDALESNAETLPKGDDKISLDDDDTPPINGATQQQHPFCLGFALFVFVAVLIHVL